MMTTAPIRPVKTRELQNVLYDSMRRNGFKLRDGDIVVAGATWPGVLEH